MKNKEGAGGYTPVERRFSRTQKLGEFEFRTRGNAVDRNLHVARFPKRFEGLAGAVTPLLTVEGNEGSRLAGACLAARAKGKQARRRCLDQTNQRRGMGQSLRMPGLWTPMNFSCGAMARTAILKRIHDSMAEHEADITGLLHRFQEGDEAARTLLVETVYDELRAIAARHMSRERDGHTLQATALVNEAYLKLVNIKAAQWQDRAHFFAVAARIMRQILVDHARQHLAGKRGGGMILLPLNEALAFTPEEPERVLQVDEALTRLSIEDELVGRVVELRFFGGLSVDETAEVLKVPKRTVEREWTFGRAWLRTELGPTPTLPME